MIINALAQLYQDLSERGKVTKPGWGKARVSYALFLSPEGELRQVLPTLVERPQGKKTAWVAKEMEVPLQVSRDGTVIRTRFLCDKASYILGLDCGAGPEKTRRFFDDAVQVHCGLLSPLNSPAARAVVAFFSQWKPEKIKDHPVLAEHLEELKAAPNVVFRLEGGYAQDDPDIQESWQRAYDTEMGEEGLCLATGEQMALARIHPKLFGVRGAQAMGVSLVSYNAKAHESYGKESGANAPIGKRTAFAYGTALDYLLADRDHCQQLGDTTVVFWAKGGLQAPQDMFAAMLGNDEGLKDQDLKAAMEKVAGGLGVRWAEEDIAPETEFFVLGLSPNAGRTSVRVFLRDSFGAFTQRLLAHQQRLEIVRPAFDTREQLSLWSLLRETVNMNAREKTPAPGMAGEVLRSVLGGGRYPATLLNGAMLRIRAESEVSRGRAAIIKAYYLRNTNEGCPKEVLTVELNESSHVPYRLGRGFSILEAIQEAANPSINATIKDKYFNSASATPATVFPILLNLAQKHLRTLPQAQKIYFEKQLTDILAGLDTHQFPTRLSLPEQGAFQLGYYHQQQKRYEKKKEEPEHV